MYALYSKIAFVFLLLSTFLNPISAQMELKLQYMGNLKWGVYAKPVGVTPSTFTQTGSGQVTVVMPAGYQYSNLVSVHGLWTDVGGTVNSPIENPAARYIPFGLIIAEPAFPIPYKQGEEILLFTFKGVNGCPDFMHLIDCGSPTQSDPFCLPNSVNVNIGNDLSVADNGFLPTKYYYFSDNYALNAWDCKDNDNDQFANAQEDTNGNGIFDAADISDMNDPLSFPLEEGIKLKLQLIGENTWGVFAKPVGITLSDFTITRSAQATVVMPSGYQYSNLVSVNGLWTDVGGIIDGPMENPSSKYVSFGLTAAEPAYPIPLKLGEETLLFTFKGANSCPDFMHLIDCGTPSQSDPFCPVNGPNHNPGNDFSVADNGFLPAKYYIFIDNYALNAWDCHDADNDGFANAQEDTNGNGIVDASDISDMNDPLSFPPEAGMNMKLQLIGENKWGVFAKPVGIIPTTNTSTATGQATIIMPLGFTYSLESVNGQWQDNSIIESPSENPGVKYVSFGLTLSEPGFPITYRANEETLLFTFESDDTCPEFMYLIECGTSNDDDPFCVPNSYNANIGNDLAIADNGYIPAKIYNYIENYAPQAWDCQDNDDDGYANADEDTNGNGIYDEGDASDLNNPDFVPAADGLNMKVALIEENKWGVFAKANNIPIGASTVTGSGQATLVMPKGYEWSNIVSVNGMWDYDSSYNGPNENQQAQYVLIDLLEAEPNFPISYSQTTETLLFTFEGDGSCPEFLYLVDCGTPNSTDPFCPINSENANPGNDLTVADNSTTPTSFYYFTDNYGHAAWDCNDCDNDGVANGLEDTNGNGAYEEWADISHFCDTCEFSAFCVPVIDVQPQPSVRVCAGNDTMLFVCGSYTLGEYYTYWEWSGDNGVTWDSLEIENDQNFTQSSQGEMMAYGCDTLSIVDVIGLQNMMYRAVLVSENNPPTFSEATKIIQEGPFEIAAHPADMTACSGDPVVFSAEILNLGSVEVEVEYQWEISLDDVTYFDAEGPIYGGEQTNELTLIDASGFDNVYFRLSATTSDCGYVYTESAQLIVFDPIQLMANPNDTTTCYGGSFSMTAIAIVDPDETPIYEWFVSSDGLDFASITDSNNGVYENFVTNQLIVNNSDGMQGYTFKMGISTFSCGQVLTEPAYLTLEGPLTITTQPQDVFECESDDVIFSVDVETGSLNPNEIEYQWETSTDGGMTWNTLINGLTPSGGDGVNGAVSDTVIVMETIGRNGHLFRAKVYTEHCDTIISNAAILNHFQDIAITQHPTDITSCAGNAFEMTAEAAFPDGASGTIDYQWQVSSDGLNWSDISSANSYEGIHTNTLSFLETDNLYGLCYRVACSSDCNILYSESACLTLQGPVEITDQPDDVSVCTDDDVLFALDVLNSSQDILHELFIEYKWEESADGGLTWHSLINGLTSDSGDGVNGVNSDSLSVMEVEDRHGYLYRVKVFSEHCDTIISESAMLRVEQFDLTGNIVDIHACENTTTFLSMDVSISPADPNQNILGFQWEESIDNGITFHNLKDGSSADGGNGVMGVTTAQLEVLETQNRVGHRIRGKAWTALCDTLYTVYSTILPPQNGGLSFIQQPQSVQNCDDGEALFLIDVETQNDPTGALANYQWQLLMPGANDWEDMYNGDTNTGINTFAGTDNDTLLITPLTGLNGALVRAIVWIDDCKTIVSQEVEILVEGPLQVIEQPTDVTTCAGMPVCFTADVLNVNGHGNVQYQWEYSVDGILWNDLTNVGLFNGIITGATTQHLCVENTTGLFNYIFRLKARTPSCDWEYSQAATLSLQGAITIESQPNDTVICKNDSHVFSTQTKLPSWSTEILYFQWQQSSDNGLTWTDISEAESTNSGGQYFDVETENLLISKVDGLNGHHYRMKVYTPDCERFTDPATLSVDDDPNCELDVPKVTLGLKLLPNRRTWAVIMKLKSGYAPSDDNILLAGEVTIAATQGFTYKNVLSKAGGHWSTSVVLTDTPDQNGLSYFTFEVAPNSNSIELKEEGTTLFTFMRDGICPDTIFIMDGQVPVGLHPNYIAGIDTGNAPQDTFYLGGYHESTTKGCLKVVGGETPEDGSTDDGFNNPNSGQFYEINNGRLVDKNVAHSFEYFPNPADQKVTIRLITKELELSNEIVFRLMSIQGQTIRTLKMNQTDKTEVDISNLTSGMYFLQMEKGGVVLQREKLVKQ